MPNNFQLDNCLQLGHSQHFWALLGILGELSGQFVAFLGQFTSSFFPVGGDQFHT